MTEEKSFEKSLKDLEDAVSRLEAGQIPLDEALDAFETGVESANLCRKRLKAVESRIEVLLKDASGDFFTENFTDNGKED